MTLFAVPLNPHDRLYSGNASLSQGKPVHSSRKRTPLLIYLMHRLALVCAGLSVISLLFTHIVYAADSKADDANAVTDQTLPIEAMRRFVDVYEKVRQNYVDRVSDDMLFDNALSGLLSRLDPYSDYLDAKTYNALVDFTDGEIGQTGLTIAPITDNDPDKNGAQWQVTDVPRGSPAAKAGVQVGDLLLKIDGKSVKTMSQNDIDQMLRGARNSMVKLTVMQAMHHPRDVRILLAIPEDNAVKAITLPNGIVVLQIRAFQTQTGEQITDTLDPLYKAGKLRAVVLDLRDNPGGLLTAAIEVANYFLNDGLIVYTQGRGEPEKYYRAVSAERYPHIPVSILINHYSASAAEVLTGALQDHQRASTYGVVSYGKGSIQKIWPIGQGRAIKMTVSRYYTPSGRMIEGTGITPDVTLPEAEYKPPKSGSTVDVNDTALLKVLDSVTNKLPKPANLPPSAGLIGHLHSPATSATFDTTADSSATPAPNTSAEPHPTADIRQTSDNKSGRAVAKNPSGTTEDVD